MSDEPDGASKQDTRMLAIAFAVLGAVLLTVALFGHHWLTVTKDHKEMGFGLRTNIECLHDLMERGPKVNGIETLTAVEKCQTHSNSEVVAEYRKLEQQLRADWKEKRLASGAFVPAGWLTLLAIALCVVSLLVSAVLALRRLSPQLQVAPTTVARLTGLVALIAAGAFVISKPGPDDMLGIGMSFWVFVLGALVGIVGAHMLARESRPT